MGRAWAFFRESRWLAILVDSCLRRNDKNDKLGVHGLCSSFPPGGFRAPDRGLSQSLSFPPPIKAFEGRL